jgi:hypothetical protein
MERSIVMPYLMGDFKISDRLIRYSEFVPRLYNLCKSYGFEPGRIMPSRAFCSDENQGYPIILITKHFGTFPFNHGQVGGIIATDRHGAHAHHGRDLVIIQASHVGYDPDTRRFGVYRRLQMERDTFSTSCGKIYGVLEWYQKEVDFARQNVTFTRVDDEPMVVIDNQLLDHQREEGLILRLEPLVAEAHVQPLRPSRVFSTAKAFRINESFSANLPASMWQPHVRTPIGDHLTADLFFFRRRISDTLEGQDQLERNLTHSMPQIITSAFPGLAAAQANTQIEFDRAYRTLVQESGYQKRNLAFIAGVHIDISPKRDQMFPLTKFVPWAAYIQKRDGSRFMLEQEALVNALNDQRAENPDQIDLDDAIRIMETTPAVTVELDSAFCREPMSQGLDIAHFVC